MKTVIVFVFALLVSSCASMAAPDIKADNVKDGTVVCATIITAAGTGKTVVAKLDQGVIRDGGAIQVDANCVMNIQLAPPLPKVAKEPAAK